METKFQTSFIPRKPLPGSQSASAPAVPHRSIGGGTGNIFMTIATLAFILSVLSIGGAYLWKVFLLRSQEDYKIQLTAKEKEFNVDQISLMKAQSSKIVLGRQVLNNHLAVSKIFSVISQLTAESVRFTSMELTVPAGTVAPMQLKLSGYGRDFSAVAFQSDVLNQLEKYGLRSIVKNPIVTSPTLNPNGAVSFGFVAQVDTSAFSYAKSLPGSATSAPASPVVPTSPAAPTVPSQGALQNQ